MARKNVARFICHPGGAKVVDAIEDAMDFEPGSLDHERGVLKDFGNMSAPTVLFVLDRVLKDPPKGRTMMAALGPGFTASHAAFDLPLGCVMVLALCFIAFLIAQRLIELVIAKRNTARLIEKGAYEVGANHYPLMIVIHSAWVVAIVFLGYDEAILWPWFAAYAVLQALRVWILTSLGSRWTTRIIILNEPLVARGPYRYIKHPNYVLVIGEIFVAPMVLGLFWVAIVFTFLNFFILSIRIPAENKALAQIDA